MQRLQNAYSALNHANRQIRDIVEIIERTPPFSYCVETDLRSCERAILVVKKDSIIDQIIMTCGSAIETLNSSLNYAYYEIVKRYTKGEKELVKLDFPFAESQERMESVFKNRLANRVGNAFTDAILQLRPYKGGDDLFWLISKFSNIKKHRNPISHAEHRNITAATIRQYVSDFPLNASSNFTIFSAKKDVVWKMRPSYSDPFGFGEIVPPSLTTYRRTINIPVNLIFRDDAISAPLYVADTLQSMYAKVDGALTILKKFA